MKKQIYLCLWVSIGLLTGCGTSQPPKTPVMPTAPTPTPLVVVPASPSPVAIVSPSPVVPAPVPVKIPPVQPTPKASPFTVTALPKSIYPVPTPVAIPVPAAPAKTKANPKPEPLTKSIDPAQQITTNGIGNAKIGMKFKELKQQMGTGFEFPIKTSFIEGFDAIAVTKAGTVQYYIPYPAGTNFTDEDRIEHLTTDNPNYRTEQGVGPGTSIARAASVYGNATLSMSKENESREFISFTQHPNGLAFRPKPAKTRSFAGDYPESNDEYLKTQKYDTKAAIGQITVSCAEDQCNKE
jgi:hypothetical protein